MPLDGLSHLMFFPSRAGITSMNLHRFFLSGVSVVQKFSSLEISSTNFLVFEILCLATQITFKFWFKTRALNFTSVTLAVRGLHHRFKIVKNYHNLSDCFGILKTVNSFEHDVFFFFS